MTRLKFYAIIVYRGLDMRILSAERTNFIALLFYGIWVSNPFLDTLILSDIYTVLLDMLDRFYLSEDSFGLVPIFLASTIYYSIKVNSFRLRRFATFASVLFWLFLSTCLIYSNASSSATAVFPVFLYNAMQVYGSLTVAMVQGDYEI